MTVILPFRREAAHFYAVYSTNLQLIYCGTLYLYFPGFIWYVFFQ